ncbi:hypothetical protein KGF56_002575 [Candida oxycetoniae]|uniref:Zn(2)-C6 fungal-type domain-containing protein n=1 Tax=Candida oxycetoniae TaxID=497107 RepID=A0AAI9SXF0_9ASCO|nr:uncharacterized protein KGF56_002575 [Candida oxycetoniae]KAI3404630.2 hypothetical protein KGF56_002575 [Candida oxycetoniae]
MSKVSSVPVESYIRYSSPIWRQSVSENTSGLLDSASFSAIDTPTKVNYPSLLNSSIMSQQHVRIINEHMVPRRKSEELSTGLKGNSCLQNLELIDSSPLTLYNVKGWRPETEILSDCRNQDELIKAKDVYRNIYETSPLTASLSSKSTRSSTSVKAQLSVIKRFNKEITTIMPFSSPSIEQEHEHEQEQENEHEEVEVEVEDLYPRKIDSFQDRLTKVDSSIMKISSVINSESKSGCGSGGGGGDVAAAESQQLNRAVTSTPTSNSTTSNSATSNSSHQSKKNSIKQLDSLSFGYPVTLNISRSRCPEERPICSQCIRLNLNCDYSIERPPYMDKGHLHIAKLEEIRALTGNVKKSNLREMYTKRKRQLTTSTTTTTTTITPEKRGSDHFHQN